MKILITGGLGYIGSHTVVEAIELGHSVTVIDNLSNSELIILDQIKKITNSSFNFINADCSDLDDLLYKIKKYEKTFDIIIHFAALKSVSESINEPIKYYDNNIVSLLNMLKITETFEVKKFIFSSSCTVYGQPSTLPVKESDPVGLITNPYAWTKNMAEQIIRDFNHVNQNCKFFVLRYFNPVGAHISGYIGELPNGTPSNLMPFITQTAFGIHSELKIYGDDYNTTDGTCIRDFIHVSDLALAHLKCINYDIVEDNKIKVFNVGVGNGYSVLQMVNTFIKETQTSLKYKFVDRRIGDIEKIWADNSLIKQELDWHPKYTLKDIVITAWNWENYYRKVIRKQN